MAYLLVVYIAVSIAIISRSASDASDIERTHHYHSKDNSHGNSFKAKKRKREGHQYLDNLFPGNNDSSSCSSTGSIGFEAIGRLGNVMFEIAAAVGVCVFKGLEPSKCVSMAPPANQGLVVYEAIDRFDIPFLKHPKCNGTFKNLFKEAPRDTGFDRSALFVPTDTKLIGYWQSHRYFYPHADKYIRSIFTFDEKIAMKANEFLLNAKSTLNDKIYLSRKTHLAVPNQKFSLVCMSVRLGDKVRDYLDVYDNWSLSSQYYRDAIDYYSNKLKNIGVMIFFGGSKNNDSQDAEDANWIKKNIIDHYKSSRSTYFFSLQNPELDKFDTLAALSMCPNIIISASSFSWWAAYLANHTNVIAPRSLYTSKYARFTPEDYYPLPWTLLSGEQNNSETNSGHYKLRGKNRGGGGGSNYSTVVSAFYAFKSKYDVSSYLKWIANFMVMDFKAVIFTNNFTYYSYLSTLWPPTYRRQYVIREINNLEVSKMPINWTYQVSLDTEINHSENLYKVWCNKPFFLSEVVASNPFETDAFAWIDIGAFRGELSNDDSIASSVSKHSLLSEIIGLPNPSKFNLNKVNFPQIYTFTSEDFKDSHMLDNRFKFVNRVGGGHIAGGSTALILFAELFRKTMLSMADKGYFVGKDQNIFAFMIINYPFLVSGVDPSYARRPRRNKWFLIQTKWADASQIDVTTPYVPRLFLNRQQSFQVAQALRDGDDMPKVWQIISSSRKTNAIMKDKDKDKGKDNSSRCNVFFAILSTAKNAKMRDAIREGWLSDVSSVYNRFSFQYKFFVGWDTSIGIIETSKIVELEKALYNDVVVLPFIDTYRNLTTKVGLILKYGESNSNCDYIFKVDDDVRINGNRMADLIDDLHITNSELLYGGYIYDKNNKKSKVSRNEKNKNSLSYDEYPRKYFVPYAGGPLYFLSRQLVKSLNYSIVHIQIPNSNIIESVPSHYINSSHEGVYKLEDAFLGDRIWRMKQTSTTTNITFYHVKNIWDYPGCIPPFLSEIDIKNVNKMRLPL